MIEFLAAEPILDFPAGGLFVIGQLLSSEAALSPEHALPLDLKTSTGDVERLYARRLVCGGQAACYGVSITTREGVLVTDSQFVSRLSRIGGVLWSHAHQAQLGVYHTSILADAAIREARQWPEVAEAKVATFFSVADWVREEHAIVGAMRIEQAEVRPGDGQLQLYPQDVLSVSYTDSSGRDTLFTVNWE